MDTIDVNLKKKKRRKLFSNIAIASALSFAVVGVGVVTIYNNDYQVTKAVEYDDENDSITLSVDELNTYTFSNFGTYLLDDVLAEDYSYDDVIVDIDYDSHTYEFNDGDEDFFSYVYLTDSIAFDMGTMKFRFYSDGQVPFSSYIYLNFSSSTFYNAVKNAIELDIQANQSYDNNTFLNDIISLLVGGISATANGIGVGLSTLVGDIAIQNGAMSSFVSIVLIFGGIALAFALSRWVVNLISSLGQRNR